MGAILYILWQKGIRENLWRLIRKLNTNMSAQVKTRFGLTRIIRIKDIIKQGGVLSVTEYNKLIDEINEELKNPGGCI